MLYMFFKASFWIIKYIFNSYFSGERFDTIKMKVNYPYGTHYEYSHCANSSGQSFWFLYFLCLSYENDNFFMN